MNPDFYVKKDKWDEKVRKGGRIGLDHVNEGSMYGAILDKLIACFKASCGAAATNVFRPICLSFCFFTTSVE